MRPDGEAALRQEAGGFRLLVPAVAPQRGGALPAVPGVRGDGDERRVRRIAGGREDASGLRFGALRGKGEEADVLRHLQRAHDEAEESSGRRDDRGEAEAARPICGPGCGRGRLPADGRGLGESLLPADIEAIRKEIDDNHHEQALREMGGDVWGPRHDERDTRQASSSLQGLQDSREVI